MEKASRDLATAESSDNAIKSLEEIENNSIHITPNSDENSKSQKETLNDGENNESTHESSTPDTKSPQVVQAFFSIETDKDGDSNKVEQTSSTPYVPPRPKYLNKRLGMLSYINMPTSQTLFSSLSSQTNSDEKAMKRRSSESDLRALSDSERRAVTLHIDVIEDGSCSSSENSPDNLSENDKPIQAVVSDHSKIEADNAKIPNAPPMLPKPPRRSLFLQSVEKHSRTRRGQGSIRQRRSVKNSMTLQEAAISFVLQDGDQFYKSEHVCRDSQHSTHDKKAMNDGNNLHSLHLTRARLEATSTTSELFAAFAMIALVELQINTPCTVPDIIWILFSINTATLVGLNIIALTISTYVLPGISAVTRLHPVALLEESPHERMRLFVHLAWGASSFLGLALFCVEIALISWVKFWDLAVEGAIISTCIVIPSLVIFVSVAVRFWRSLNEQCFDAEDEVPVVSTAPASLQSSTTFTSNFTLDMLPVASDVDSLGGRFELRQEDITRLRWRRLHIAIGKLHAAGSTSELIAGFATMAMVELQTNTPTMIPRWMFVLLAINTTVLVLLHVFALMVSTFLLPSVQAAKDSNQIASAPHESLKNSIQVAWACSAILGMLLFLTEVSLLCWIKFWDFSYNGALSSSLVIFVAVWVFIAFAVHFWHVVRQSETVHKNIDKIEETRERFHSTTNLEYQYFKKSDNVRNLWM